MDTPLGTSTPPTHPSTTDTSHPHIHIHRLAELTATVQQWTVDRDAITSELGAMREWQAAQDTAMQRLTVGVEALLAQAHPQLQATESRVEQGGLEQLEA